MLAIEEVGGSKPGNAASGGVQVALLLPQHAGEGVCTAKRESGTLPVAARREQDARPEKGHCRPVAGRSVSANCDKESEKGLQFYMGGSR